MMNPALIAELGYLRVVAAAPRVRPADVSANVAELLRHVEEAVHNRADIVLFPELSITGYTCGDLFTQSTLLNAALDGLATLCRETAAHDIVMIVGLPLAVSGRLYNVAAVVHGGRVQACIPKTHLAATQEFYETRWFTRGTDVYDDMVRIGEDDVPFGADILCVDDADPSVTFGIEICQDLWSVEPPSGPLAREGATLIFNLSASNDLVGKASYRRDLIRMQSARTYTAYVYASSGPGESTTDAVFSGHCIVAECGDVVAESQRLQLNGASVCVDVDVQRCARERMAAASWSMDHHDGTMRVVHLALRRSIKDDVQRRIDPHPFVPHGAVERTARCTEILELQAMGLAVRAQRSHAKALVLGLSGGLDSTLAALVCRRACEILNVPFTTIHTVSLPGFGTTTRTRTNAQHLARAIGAEFREIDITPSVMQHFADIGHDPDSHTVVYENAQARMRTTILMDVANMEQGIVVGTGDLSEIALGWSTFNADHMSMYNPNAGVPKTLVRELIRSEADRLDDLRAVLVDVLDTPISPELLPTSADGVQHQRTEDVLGPYEVHDFVLYHAIRRRCSAEQVAVLALLAFGSTYRDAQILHWVDTFYRRFVAAQFKRSAMPDGPKIGSVSLSPRADWRMPSDAVDIPWRDGVRRIAELAGVTIPS